jgi:hypothetical protein
VLWLAEGSAQEAFRWVSVLGRVAMAQGAWVLVLASEPEPGPWVSLEGIRGPAALVLAWLVSLELCALVASNRLAKEIQRALMKETLPLAWESCPARLVLLVRSMERLE